MAAKSSPAGRRSSLFDFFPRSLLTWTVVPNQGGARHREPRGGVFGGLIDQHRIHRHPREVLVCAIRAAWQKSDRRGRTSNPTAITIRLAIFYPPETAGKDRDHAPLPSRTYKIYLRPDMVIVDKENI